MKVANKVLHLSLSPSLAHSLMKGRGGRTGGKGKGRRDMGGKGKREERNGREVLSDVLNAKRVYHAIQSK